ncbi:MAG: PAS domain S-box protein [Desulfobulbaceae bacterium]|nr:PAS domain S-box protein [Desulfobulbaceae bacterium]
MTPQTAPESESLASGYVTVDENWIVTTCNQKASIILGLENQDIIGKHCRDIFAYDTRFKDICSHIEPLSSLKGSRHIESNLGIPIDSKKDAVLYRIITIPGKNGHIAGAIIAFADLSEPFASSRLALNSIAEGVFTVDKNWQITSFNAAAEQLTGWTENEVIGKECKQIFKANICRTNCAISDCIHTKAVISDRMAYIESKDGRSIPVKLRAAPMFDKYDNVIGGVETFIDITATMQYELILAAVADGVFTVDPTGRITSFNKAAERITGYTEPEVLGRICSEILLSSKNFQSCPLSTCMQEKTSIIDRELFIIGKDGYSIPVSVSAAPFVGHNGDILGGVQSFRNNTQRLQKALILDSVASGVFTVDRDWRITSFNLSAELITGWNRESAIGQYCSDVFCSSICGKNCAIAESLYTGLPVANRTIKIKNRSGKMVSVSISTAPLVDHDGNVLGGVETFRDLSVEMSLRQQLTKKFTFEQMVSKSPAMQRMFQIMPEISKSESNVLILGESGTGKELVASAIYHASARNDQPFIVVNCGALPDTLLESELFGYKAGAFTDARKDKLGRFAAAEGGTIFLDEIGDIPHSLQVKLLRVLQQKVYEPLGSNSPLKADVRIIAATNKNLLKQVQQGEFRDDLYYRLNVVNILLPPLRERLEDVPLLIEHFVKKFRAEKQKDIVGVSDEVITLLMKFDYPGNIRELENIIEYGFILCPGGFIQLEHLPETFGGQNQQNDSSLLSVYEGLSLEKIEKSAIHLSLQRNKWKKMLTCRELGISKDTLRRKIERYQLVNPLETTG